MGALTIDTYQAIGLSRALRAKGWKPVGASSPRRFDAELVIRSGQTGQGSSMALSLGAEATTREAEQRLSADLAALGYRFDRSELEDGGALTVYFRRVKKV